MRYFIACFTICSAPITVLTLAFCLFAPTRVSTQHAPLRSQVLDREVEVRAKRASLPGILEDLATRYGIAVLADGWPLRDTADLDFRGSLRDALDRIAEAFDYTWKLSSKGMVLLNKRFKNPDERPQLNLLELRHVAKEMLTALPPVESAEDHTDWGKMIVTLADMLSPEQTQMLQSGKKLAASDLTPAQRILLERIILTRGFSVPRGVWERLYFQLDNMKSSVVQLVDPFPNLPAVGQSRTSYYIMHVARGKGGQAVQTRLGQLDKEIQP